LKNKLEKCLIFGEAVLLSKVCGWTFKTT